MRKCPLKSDTVPKGRDETIDTAKGIGIVLVFLGHLLVYDSSNFRLIFNIHMPLFFFLSGMVFKPEDRLEFSDFARKAANSLFLPLGVFTILGTLIACLTGTFLPQDGNVLLWCAEIWHGTPSFVPSAWFILCLFLTQGLFWATYHYSPKKRLNATILGMNGGMLLLFVCIASLSLRTKMLFPFSSSSVPGAFVFFSLGHLLRSFNLTRSIFLTGLLPVVFFGSRYTTPNLAVPEVARLDIFVLCSSCGILALLALSKLINNPILRFIGRHSLVFFLLEGHVSIFILHIGRRIVPSLTSNPMTDSLGSWQTIMTVFILELGCCALFAPCLTKAFNSIRRRIFQ